MKLPKFDNASVIETLKNVGCKVRIRHLRNWREQLVKHPFDLIVEEVIDQKGGQTEVSIFTDDHEFKCVAKNPKTNQYNKNFGVHVALQRAIKIMNKHHSQPTACNLGDDGYNGIDMLEEWAAASKL